MTGIEIAMMAVTAAGSAVSAAGTMFGADASASAARYNAALARRNAILARNQASAEAGDQRRQNMRQLASIHAMYGSSGLTLDGSSLDVLADSAAEQELGVQRTLYKGELNALGLQEKAQQYEAEADNAETAGTIGVIGDIGGGMTKMASIGGGGGGSNKAGSSLLSFLGMGG